MNPKKSPRKEIANSDEGTEIEIDEMEPQVGRHRESENEIPGENMKFSE